ncbi:MAG TPA: hypothetical protein VKO85_14160 [Wenzhouxiangellaceae bacterium]|nr:hypothetical protein [Wenzhouxiangellaceae bacterium]
MNIKTYVLLLTAVCLLCACATDRREIRLEPPTLQVESLRIEDGMVYFRLLVHNRNDHVLYLSEAAVAMRIDGIELFNAAWQLDLDMGPRGRELISLDASAMQAAAEILSALGPSDAAGVPFELSAEFVIEDMRNAEIGQRGFLHPVPGQPGVFR